MLRFRLSLCLILLCYCPLLFCGHPRVWMGGCILQGGLLSEFQVGHSPVFSTPSTSLPSPPLSCARSRFIAFHLQICFSLPCFVTWDLDSVSISPLPAGLMLGFVSRGTELKGPCKAIEGEGVSFPISGVLIFSGVWLFVDFTPSDTPRPSQTTQEAILWTGSSPFTHSPSRFPRCHRPLFCSLWTSVLSLAGCVFLQRSGTSLCRV